MNNGIYLAVAKPLIRALVVVALALYIERRQGKAHWAD